MPRRRWRMPRLAMLTDSVREYFSSGADISPDMLRELPLEVQREIAWRLHGPQFLADWIRERPATRPYAWWFFDASEPRRVLRGAELVLPGTGWAWIWRARLGCPGLRRPAGGARGQLLQDARSHDRAGATIGCLLEGEGAYLRRLNLLEPGEVPTVESRAPVSVQPFLDYDERSQTVTLLSLDDPDEDETDDDKERTT